MPATISHSEREAVIPSIREGSAVPRYEVVGLPAAPAIVALGGISANHHICSSRADPSPGWWENIAGQGKALNTEHFALVGLSFLDSAGVTTYDQADALASALDDAGIERLHALVGASYGGMVALAFAERYPERLARLVVIGAAHKAHPLTTALRVIQRRIVELAWETGRTYDGLVLARALATTTYRSAREFAARFDGAAEVEKYLLHQGEKFAARFTAERFLALSLSADEHSVDPTRITTPTTLVAAEGDTNTPREQLEELATKLAGPCRLIHVPTIHGHDAFLTEPAAFSRILTDALRVSHE